MVKTRTAVGVGAIALGLGIMFASPASATKGHHHKEWVCHPVEGKGELN